MCGWSSRTSSSLFREDGARYDHHAVESCSAAVLRYWNSLNEHQRSPTLSPQRTEDRRLPLAPQILVYPKAATVAERFQAMIVLGMTNSRMKDHYDLRALAKSANFGGGLLADALPVEQALLAL
jgi:hypothetical protein